MGDEKEIACLLRPLGEAAFLRQALEALDEPPPAGYHRLVEEALAALREDGERPGALWERVTGEILGEAITAPWMLWRRILRLIDRPFCDRARRRAHSAWGLPDLLAAAAVASPAAGYAELHCHHRGAVPFASLWRAWIDDEVWRCGALRQEVVSSGRWSATWAQLLGWAALIEEWLTWVGAPSPKAGATQGELNRWLGEQIRAGSPRATAATAYLAIQVSLRRSMIHQRGEVGLDPFVRSYDRYARAQAAAHGSRVGRTLLAATLRRFEEEGAAAVELRATIDHRVARAQQKLQDLVLGYFDYLRGRTAAAAPVAFGIIVSLFKQEDGGLAGGEGGAETWPRQRALWRQQVETLLALVDRDPLLRYFVVGLDAAGRERGCPTRLFAEPFRQIRRYNRDSGVGAARPGREMDVAALTVLSKKAKSSEGAVDQLRRSWGVRPCRLGRTIHAGEDFVDPMDGLRQIDEAITHLELGPGDRIGHGIALALEKEEREGLLRRRSEGLSPSSSGRGGEPVAARESRGLRLLTLAWERSGSVGPHGPPIAYQLAEVAARTFGVPGNPSRLAEVLQRNEALLDSLPGIRFRDGAALPPEDEERIVLDSHWAERFEAARGAVLRRIVERQIVIESCPTSNVVVANLDRAPLHALLQVPGLRVVMATDNPGLFGIWPQDELRNHGFPASVWQRLRDESLAAGFVWPLP